MKLSKFSKREMELIEEALYMRAERLVVLAQQGNPDENLVDRANWREQARETRALLVRVHLYNREKAGKPL